jgi:DNA-directed RNA polymerase subunit L
MILSAIKSSSNSIKFTLISLENDLTEGILYIPGETYTIGEIIKRFVYENVPEIASISYHIVTHENKLVLSIRHVSDVTAILVNAINNAIEVMETIQKNIVDTNIILQHKMP